MDARTGGIHLQSRRAVRTHAHPWSGWTYLASPIHQSRVHRQPHCPRLPRRQPHSYSDHLYATPFFDLRQRPRYAVADVWFLSTRYPYRGEVDLGIKALGDLTVQAEVRRYRGLEYQLNQLQNELIELENRIGSRQMEKDQCIRRMEQADVLQRIHEANNKNISGAQVRVVELLQDLERGRSS
jgi:hypothetical protein